MAESPDEFLLVQGIGRELHPSHLDHQSVHLHELGMRQVQLELRRITEVGLVVLYNRDLCQCP